MFRYTEKKINPLAAIQLKDNFVYILLKNSGQKYEM